MFTLGHYTIHQAESMHFLSSDRCSRKHNLHSAVLAKGARQALCSACPGNDAKINLRLPKTRIFGGHDHVTMHCQFASSPQGIAANGSNHGFMNAFNTCPGFKSAKQHVYGRLIGHLLDGSSRRKGSFTGHVSDQTADLVIAIKLSYGIVKLANTM